MNANKLIDAVANELCGGVLGKLDQIDLMMTREDAHRILLVALKGLRDEGELLDRAIYELEHLEQPQYA
tara:strand:+ start:7756 stop:7962 length:207 start_codon:yes stop_codon:yes gene_type:complete